MLLALLWLLTCTALAIVATDGLLDADYPRTAAASLLLLAALVAGKD